MSANRSYQHPYGCSLESQYGIASNMYANVNVNYDIPEQSGYVSGLMGHRPYNQVVDMSCSVIKSWTNYWS